MKHDSTFAQIGNTPEQETYGTPALRCSLSEIGADYDAKSEGIPAAFETFNAAETAINAAGCIGGTYGSAVLSTSPSLYERDVRIALLRSAWKHVYEGLNIKAVASARDRKQLDLELTTPLPFTLENIAEVSGDYLIDPGFHVPKGLAECFCDLTRPTKAIPR